MTRREWHEVACEAPPHPDLGLVVAIPCHDEPGLSSTLASLWRCARPRRPTEVIVVVNGSEHDPAQVRTRNRATLDEAARWLAGHRDERLRFQVTGSLCLGHRHAGVGLARRIAMDTAMRRLERSDAGDGVIASLDADCHCDPNYLAALESHFEDHPRSSACSIYFEHPLHGGHEPLLYEAVARYELYLRYFRHGLAHAGLPYAHYTIGSCMAVRASAYRREGGMNRRKGGEDFYFLQKMMASGGFSELNTTRVVPSPRPSSRATFGTGRAVARAVDGRDSELLVAAPRVFSDLRALVAAVPWLRACGSQADGALRAMPRAMREFLATQSIRGRLEEIRRNTASAATFRARFFRWFNLFRCRKFIRHALDRHYREVPVEQAADLVLRWRGVASSSPSSPRELLDVYRALDRAGSCAPSKTCGRPFV